MRIIANPIEIVGEQIHAIFVIVLQCLIDMLDLWNRIARALDIAEVRGVVDEQRQLQWPLYFPVARQRPSVIDNTRRPRRPRRHEARGNPPPARNNPTNARNIPPNAHNNPPNARTALKRPHPDTPPQCGSTPKLKKHAPARDTPTRRDAASPSGRDTAVPNRGTHLRPRATGPGKSRNRSSGSAAKHGSMHNKELAGEEEDSENEEDMNDESDSDNDATGTYKP
jgi:hypothetical protein